MTRLPHKTLERKLFKDGYSAVLGVDEVGMGCLAGPVVVCAVRLEPEFYRKANPALARLRDSKLLLPHQRETYAEELLKMKSLKFKICYCHSGTIDKINIYQAARRAMRRAVERLTNPKYEIRNPKQIPRLRQGFGGQANSKFQILNSKSVVLVDGPHPIAGLDMDQIPIVKGDRKVFAIACASVIAKVYRDRMMSKYAKKYPGYGFEIHKGYGTKLHRARLAELGPTHIHRQSFRWQSEIQDS